MAPYFSKVECFCFEEQKLLAGEEVDMPLLFFIDRDILEDPACRNLDDVVLSYTFFRYAPILLSFTVCFSERCSRLTGRGGTRRATLSPTPRKMSYKHRRASTSMRWRQRSRIATSRHRRLFRWDWCMHLYSFNTNHSPEHYT